MAPRYDRSLLKKSLHFGDVWRIVVNIAILAPIFTIIGAFISAIFFYLFDDYEPRASDPDKRTWEKRSLTYQIFDVLIEVALIPVLGLLITYAILSMPFIVPVAHEFQKLVDQFSFGLFFSYAILIFMTPLSDKLRYVVGATIGEFMDHIMPDAGNILDMNLRYSTEAEKKLHKNKQFRELEDQLLHGNH